MNTFWMTWTGDEEGLEPLGGFVSRFRREGVADRPWRIKAHRRARVGDQVFLFAQSEPRGIFGIGTITADPFPWKEHSTNPNKPQYYAPTRFTRLVDPTEQFLLPLDQLIDIVPKNFIGARASGNPLDAGDVAAVTKRLTSSKAGETDKWNDAPPLNRDEFIRGPEESDDIQRLLADPNLPPTERLALVAARLGQGKFRENVLESWEGGCAVSGCSLRQVLRASHIKPWRESTNAERLDPHNGLPLTANLDALFDSYLISFDTDGALIVSELVGNEARQIIGSHRRLRRAPSAEMESYLTQHRVRIARKRKNPKRSRTLKI